MKKEDLQIRIEKKEEAIKKIEKRIAKWSAQCSEEEKEIADRFRDSYPKFVRYAKEHGMSTSFTACYELRNAYVDLDSATATLEKYKKSLDVILQRESVEKIPILVEFFALYRKQVIQFIEENMEVLQEYYIADRDRWDWKYNKRKIMEQEQISEEEWNATYKSKQAKAQELSEQVHPMTKDVYNSSTKSIDYNELNNILDKDIDAKYWNLIHTVSKHTGEIIDMANVRIGGDGNLNGIVVGKEGNAKLETIMAGGYNQNRIVNVRKGQILHYRLLVHPIQ